VILARGIEPSRAAAENPSMSSSIPSGFDPQTSLDAALFAAAGGSSTSSSDPAIAALDELGSSYGDEIAFLQQQLEPSTGAYDASGMVPGAAAEFEQTLAGLLGGDSPASFDGPSSLVDLLG
jgi:hypothetical protein